ncbi:hypothetical protein GA0070614_0424 [Micromonospora coxensis]|uniref:Fibronectin type-III domain-containing protein n=2 Tax=Micromonospora coxensis TaxID=356852 RepID=A0A1C5GVB4_9ACTN|nr:hypothetical protein GA0070614_0424 [Micromonospora coxensis]
MVYQGLTPAEKGEPCVGAYEVAGDDDCSHGPDPVPPGLDIGRDVKPVAPVRTEPTAPRPDPKTPRDAEVAEDAGALAPAESTPAVVPDAAAGGLSYTLGESGVVCAGDGTDGKRVQVLYAYEAGRPSRFGQYLESFRAWAAGVDAIYAASARATGGTRHVRYVVTPDCRVDVLQVQLPSGALSTFKDTIEALRALDHDRTDRKYMIFADANVYCGIGTFVGDERSAATNRNNLGPSYGRTDAGCWTPSVAAHELTHNLGAVFDSAPNSSKAGHCVDDFDVMCYKDADTTKVRVVCGDRGLEKRLDCNHDDYFHTDPKAGSYLDTHWNVADNGFLVKGEPSVGPSPTPSGATPTSGPPGVTPTPEPTPVLSPTSATPSPTGTTAAPSPDVTTVTPGPSGTDPVPSPTVTPPPNRVKLTVSDTTATSTRLAWPAGPVDARYAVLVDGRSIARTAATRVSVIGMRPGTAYRVQIALVQSGGGLQPYTEVVTVRTTSPVAAAANEWLSLHNALTGAPAEVHGSRRNDGVPLVLGSGTGAANQAWRLVPATEGMFLIVSKATGKCVAPLGGTAVRGVPLVQVECAPGQTGQRWRVTRTDAGLRLGTADGALVVGIGSRYGVTRLLTLQRPDGSRHQSWTPRPA